MSDLNPNLDDPILPEQLARALREQFGQVMPVPRDVDDSILADARAGYSRRMRFRRTTLWMGAIGTAAAAAVVLAVWVNRPDTTPTTPRPVVAQAPGDIDGSGRVDILDAYILATRVERERNPRSEWDLNRDGKVDRTDVEQIATAAVRLPEGVVQ